MDEEIVDIVDADCTVLSCIAKTEAHRKGLLHRTVIAEVRDSKGNWILVKQAADRQDAGQYVSPVGGHVKAGESDEDALKRETLEEIGLTDFEYEHVGNVIYERKVIGRHENHYFIVYKIYSDNDFKLGNEAVGHKTFSEAELRAALKASPEQFGAAFIVLLETFYPHILPQPAN
jgi:isopentenyl-diphosphate Delta-isomerase